MVFVISICEVVVQLLASLKFTVLVPTSKLLIVFGNSTAPLNEALKDAVIGKSPLALAIIYPSFVPQNDTSFCHNLPSMGKKAVSIDCVTIEPSLSLTYNIKEREGNSEADIIGWNKSFVGV